MTDRQAKNNIPPIFRSGGIKIITYHKVHDKLVKEGDLKLPYGDLHHHVHIVHVLVPHSLCVVVVEGKVQGQHLRPLNLQNLSRSNKMT
ncbi:hypothetical protein DPMN_029106 [Dreissena polymorpha]|uniref:Uncharacterized protein n=1 Tax=Dreissena polymorpha TaxID=45954 RepID=A0A9D4RH26_DREPO|nr:hypothetical protein DPMN_029106 [Dreissena polymorpha]